MTYLFKWLIMVPILMLGLSMFKAQLELKYGSKK